MRTARSFRRPDYVLPSGDRLLARRSPTWRACSSNLLSLNGSSELPGVAETADRSGRVDNSRRCHQPPTTRVARALLLGLVFLVGRLPVPLLDADVCC